MEDRSGGETTMVGIFGLAQSGLGSVLDLF